MVFWKMKRNTYRSEAVEVNERVYKWRKYQEYTSNQCRSKTLLYTIEHTPARLLDPIKHPLKFVLTVSFDATALILPWYIEHSQSRHHKIQLPRTIRLMCHLRDTKTAPETISEPSTRTESRTRFGSALMMVFPSEYTINCWLKLLLLSKQGPRSRLLCNDVRDKSEI